MEAIANIWTILIVLTALVFTITYFWIVVQAFKEHLLWGMAVLLVPVVYLVFSILIWKHSRRPFLIGLAAGMAIVIELLITKLFQAIVG